MDGDDTAYHADKGDCQDFDQEDMKPVLIDFNREVLGENGEHGKAENYRKDAVKDTLDYEREANKPEWRADQFHDGYFAAPVENSDLQSVGDNERATHQKTYDHPKYHLFSESA